MSLPSAPVPRRRLHVRRIEIEGFQRDDGLFELEASLCDTKDIEYYLPSGNRPAGAPVHQMRIRVTIDRHFTVIAVEALTEAAPYPGHCEPIAPAYAALVGLNLFDGFRRAVSERLGETKGCTHLTELVQVLPTAALQTVATLVQKDTVLPGKPYPLDRCHALESSSEAVRRYYPDWHRSGAAPGTDLAHEES